jgi:PEGA domain
MRNKKINFFTDHLYHISRGLFFWLFSFLFVVCAPVVVYLSLGYKLDVQNKKFIKTGAISVKAFPDNSQVILKGDAKARLSPCVIRELLPGVYDISIEKPGFYPYAVKVIVKPSAVSEVDLVLVPKIESFDNTGLNLNIYKFFMSKRFFGEKIIAFAADGVYFLDKSFKDPQKVSPLNLSQEDGCSINSLIETDKNIIFWNNKKIWNAALGANSVRNTPVYETSEGVSDVFLGLKDRYLIIHDGARLIAMDMSSPLTFYQLLAFKSKSATVFYDTADETLYVNDFVPQMNSFSMFKTQLVKLMFFNHEEKRN